MEYINRILKLNVYVEKVDAQKVYMTRMLKRRKRDETYGDGERNLRPNPQPKTNH